LRLRLRLLLMLMLIWERVQVQFGAAHQKGSLCLAGRQDQPAAQERDKMGVR
jgi:hypothetical protein